MSNEALPPMRYRTLGKTGLQVSALALGTVELGVDYGIMAPGHFGKPPVDDAIHLIHAACDAGINLIDTARAYGTSEEILGLALSDRRNKVILASKVSTQAAGGVPMTGDRLRVHMEASLAASLAALNTDYLDIWQIHNVDRATLQEGEIIQSVFDTARRAGKVRYVGGSFYGSELPELALAHQLFDVMQITYSLLDQRLADNFFAQATAAGIGILARSVLLKGALTDRAEHLPDHLSPLRLRSRAFRELVADAKLGANPAQAAIAFALQQPAIHSVLIGVRTAAELRSNLRSLAVELPPALSATLASLRLDDADLLNPSTWGIP